jgi:drug/metabolite transporter superfamily protein YnfA
LELAPSSGQDDVTNIGILLVLLVAATLEAGGDWLVRQGLHAPSVAVRAAFLAVGGIVLFVYGVVVNLPPWNFGRLLGVYVTLFFVVAQVINWAGYGVRPTTPILVGGALIAAGGLTITVWQ